MNRAEWFKKGLLEVVGRGDSDWAGDSATRQSVAGYHCDVFPSTASIGSCGGSAGDIYVVVQRPIPMAEDDVAISMTHERMHL